MHSIKPIHGLLFALLFALSLPIKLAAANNIPWEIDIVPVLSRTVEYGGLPPVGTLSSVAAYNMPMLQWLHAPALWLTGNAAISLVLTLLVFNWLGMLAMFWVGSDMFRPVAGLLAAALFAFSEVGISSSYTAWAQLLLPGFFAMTFALLWAWRWYERGFFLALAGIVATAAFMTHFSAVLLYPAMLIFALLSRAKWQWRWLLAGSFVCVLMLAPYLVFEIERDFADVRAFITQDTLVDADVMEVYGQYKPGAQSSPRTSEAAPPTAVVEAEQEPIVVAASQNRILAYVQRAIPQTWNSFLSPLTVNTRELQAAFEPLAPILRLG
ncbi:MAG: glycosyltransferase family 39 protein, partial [Anaerolineae bacterium]|nr:glycosyltransferase family 39 protein [Anaerolineae bacterium]